MLKSTYRTIREFGFDPIKTFRSINGLGKYLKDLRKFTKIKKIDTIFPFLSEYNCDSGNIKGHYFHQDLLVARKIYQANPKEHLDVGSRIDGFIAHLAVFRKVNVLDIRPQKSSIKNVSFLKGDLSDKTTLTKIGGQESISCLHTLEHIGLGRYGDKIDPQGHLKAMKNLKQLLKRKGKLYLSVPIGNKERIEFNAHRIFNIETLLSIFSDFKLVSFSYIDDNYELHENVSLSDEEIKNSFGLNMGCGIFEFVKVN
jgi:hypothetical protein